MKPISWKIWFLIASILFHAALLTWLKMPVILARMPQTALIFDLVDRPKPYIPPDLPKEKPKPIVKQDEQKPPEKREIEKLEPKPVDAPPPPPAESPVSDEAPAPGEAVINPEPGGVPGGVEGGTPGGVVGGTGDGNPDVKPEPPPAPEPEPEPEPKVDVKAIQSQYVSGVKSKIYGSKFYPESAKRMEQEGSVKVSFTVSSGGSVSGVSVSSSSGFSELDNAAVQAVKNAAPFGAIPPELGKSSLTMSITLKYYLK